MGYGKEQLRQMKVISVGNIIMGGAGKTPHTIEIVKEYINRGEKVVILSLGYKGKLGYETNVISDGVNVFHKPPLAADEPYMMALECPKAAVITGKNRALSLEYAKGNFGSTVAVLDDGFQYKGLKKNADILLLDYKRPISTGFPFPFGYLREMPSAIGRADIIVFTRAYSDKIPERVKKYINDKPVFFSQTVTDKIVINGKALQVADFKGVCAAAFSAVASNKSFYRSLEKNGINIINFKGFADHGVPSERALESFVDKAKKQGAQIFLTTQKDYVKLSDEYKNIFGYLKMEIEISHRNIFFDKITELTNR